VTKLALSNIDGIPKLDFFSDFKYWILLVQSILLKAAPNLTSYFNPTMKSQYTANFIWLKSDSPWLQSR